MTGAGTSVGLHFRIILHGKSSVAKQMFYSWIMEVWYPRFPFVKPKRSFMLCASFVSSCFEGNYVPRSGPTISNTVILWMSSPLIRIFLLPIHRYPSCTNASSCLTTMVTCVLRPKWGTLSIFNKLASSKPAAHYFTSNKVTAVSWYLKSVSIGLVRTVKTSHDHSCLGQHT